MGALPFAAEAQSLRRDGGPAEIPPASYTGSQYVDSKGCIYIRAGVDGNVTWVPRVSRERKVLCGFEPSQVASSAAPAPAASSGAVSITAAQPENAAPPAPEPAPATTARASAPQPAPRPTRVIRPAAVAVAEPAPVTPVPAARPQIVAPARPTGATACPNLSPIAQQYMRPGPYEISCGPSGYAAPSVQTQTYRPGEGLVVSAPVVKPGQVPAGTRVVPRHVYENNYLATTGVSVPEGYAPAFDDDRLNPHRGVQTFEGKARMDGTWTQTVPRRLLPVTAQPAAPVISSQTRVPATAPRRAAPYRYVQVGSFAQAGNAQSTAARMQTAGIPVRISSSGRYQVVLLGPFGTEADMAHALSAARRAGFDDAFPRN